MVFIKELGKNIFPKYLPPERDEIFSSWFCRLSFNHEVKTNTFIQNYMNRTFPLWNRDIDFFAPNPLLEMLESRTPMDNGKILDLFLKSYEGFAFIKHRTTGNVQNVTPIGVHHRKRLKFGQQYCSSCLKKEPVIYKKQWRLLTSIICTDCNEYLHDRCPCCKKPIMFFRVNIRPGSNKSSIIFKPLYLCSVCNFDLRNSIHAEKPSELEIEYQKYIDSTIGRGYNDVAIYSFTYIRVLLLLALRLRSTSKNNRFKYIVSSTLDKSFPPIREKEIKYWSVEERIETFPFVFFLLKDYPKTLSKLFREGAVYYNYLVNDTKYLPYWFEKIFHF